MKKLLFATLLASACGLASAQNSVTLYGTLDAGAYSITNASATQNASGLVDSSMTSSLWGIRVAEDVGNGTTAVANLEGDLQTNNGGMNQNGLFRRGAYVGLANRQLGELDLGLKNNPLIVVAHNILPVAGDSVNFVTTIALGYADFFTKNAVTYTTPGMAGMTATVQYGLGNHAADGTDIASGSVVAFNLIYSGIDNLKVLAAGQERRNGGVASVSANSNSANKNTYIVGANYKLGNWSVGAGYASNRTDTGTAVGNVDAAMIGVGYQLTPAVLLGANYVRTNDSASLTNVQAHYSFSKRTEVYAQIGYAQNGTTTSNPIAPIFQTTGTSPGVDISGYSAVAGQNQTGAGVGIIHRF